MERTTARPLRIAYPHALYHVINRGHRRDAIFTCDDDRREFLRRLQCAVRKYRSILRMAKVSRVGSSNILSKFEKVLATDKKLTRIIEKVRDAYR